MLRSTEGAIFSIAEDKDLVFRFFAVFSRFEYALKRSKFLKPKDRAEADWDAYADDLRGRFTTVVVPAFKEACAYLIKKPPRTQIVLRDGLGWKKTVRRDTEVEERYVLRLVRTVRNNLFHGGKYPYPIGPVLDAARDRHLLECCLAVLEECLKLSPDVRRAFEEAA
jgi:hypothetical protein